MTLLTFVNELQELGLGLFTCHTRPFVRLYITNMYIGDLVILDIDRFSAYSGPRLRSCLQTPSVIFKAFNFALLNYLGVSFEKYRHQT